MITLASQLLEKTVSSNASDVFIVAGLPVSMDASLLKLYKDGTIAKDTALTYATNPEMLKRRL